MAQFIDERIEWFRHEIIYRGDIPTFHSRLASSVLPWYGNKIGSGTDVLLFSADGLFKGIREVLSRQC